MFDIGVVVVFLLLTVFVGMGHGRKIKTINDYALGGQNFSTAALVATIVATYSGGSGFMITLSQTYTEGLDYVFSVLSGGVSFVILAYVLIPRMKEFLGKVSIAEAIGDMYGTNARIITAIAGAIGSSGLIAVQFRVFGNILSNFMGLPYFDSIIISGTIVTIYSAFGGIRAVTVTDVLQFATFGIILPLLSFVIWNDFYSDGLSVKDSLNDPIYDFNRVFSFDNPNIFGMWALFIYFCMPTMSAPAFQRIAMGRDTRQVKTAFLISGVLLILIKISIAWVPFLIRQINSGIEKNQLLFYIIDTYTYVGLKGAIITAIIAFAMSTADSWINVSTVLVTHDIFKPIFRQKVNEINTSRVFAILLGFFSIWLALYEGDLVDIIIFGNSFYYPIVTPIFLLSIFGFRSTPKAALTAMLSGFLFTIWWKSLDVGFGFRSGYYFKVFGVLVSMLINATVLITFHYLFRQSGGWIKTIGHEDVARERAERKKEWKQFFTKLRQFNLYKYLTLMLPSVDDDYIRMGAYFIVYTITTMYSTHSSLLGQGAPLLSVIYPAMLITGTLMLMFHLWPKTISAPMKKKIITIWWPLSTFYMLIMFNSFFVLLSDFGLLQCLVGLLNFLVILTIYKWQASALALPVGTYTGVKLYEYMYGNYKMGFDLGSPEAVMAYLLIMLATTIILFVKPRQEQQEKVLGKLEKEVTHLYCKNDSLGKEVSGLNKQVDQLSTKVDHYSEKVADQEKEIERLGSTAQRILNNVNHELRLPVGNVMNFAEMLNDGVGKLSEDDLKMMSDEVYKSSTRLSTMILNMLDLAMLSANRIELKKSKINFGELVEDRVKTCRKIYLEGKKINFKLSILPNIIVSVDPNYMRQVVDNIIINSINFSDEGMIEVEVGSGEDYVYLIIKDQGLGIPKNELFDIFRPFKMGSNTVSDAHGRGVGLALCKAAVDAHGGKITASSDGISGAEFVVILPL